MRREFLYTIFVENEFGRLIQETNEVEILCDICYNWDIEGFNTKIDITDNTTGEVVFTNYLDGNQIYLEPNFGELMLKRMGN